jgi:hypothetical protein
LAAHAGEKEGWGTHQSVGPLLRRQPPTKRPPQQGNICHRVLLWVLRGMQKTNSVEKLHDANSSEL